MHSACQILKKVTHVINYVFAIRCNEPHNRNKHFEFLQFKQLLKNIILIPQKQYIGYQQCNVTYGIKLLKIGPAWLRGVWTIPVSLQSPR